VWVGIMIDKIGVRIFIVLFTIIFVVGHIIFAASIIVASFPLALLGRFIFGVGDGCLCIAESVFITKWFFCKEISLAMSIGTCLSRAFNALALVVFPILHKRFESIRPSLNLSTGTVLFSLILSFVLTYMDKHYEIKDKKNGYPQDISNSDKMACQGIKSLKPTSGL
jgi:MFS family permease